MVLNMTRFMPRNISSSFAVLVLVSASAFSSCASVHFDRTTPTSGTFTSSATSVTFFGFDFPTHALLAARGNASDATQPNTVATTERVFPYLGAFDWILDIFSVRFAKITGTWGYAE